jgi:asparagine synthase (glutamine-hydrolysing)
MCGIAGIIGNNNTLILNNMLSATRHRGPDDQGIFFDERCAIGMNRLSILDLSQAGHQPMFSDDKRYVIVYNGEVYNFKTIRDELIKLGFSFHSNTDTEVVLKGYQAYGKNLLNKIRGMFAFLVWDTHTQTAFGARDHMGIKPFYYHHQNGVFTFCSEIKGMLQQPAVKKQVSIDGLRLFLSYGYIGAPYTILDSVFALKPGECFTLEQNKLSIETYWDIPTFTETTLTYEQAKTKLHELVVEKVSEELVSDVPLGLFLSGGLDSTVVLAAMHSLGKERIETFSLGFEGLATSEENEARIAANFYQTKHAEFIISGKNVADEFDNFIDAMDQPCTDGLNVFLVSKYTSRQVKVALSGIGPDEMFLGYKWQRSAMPPSWFNKTIFNAILPVLRPIWPKRYIGILNYLVEVQDVIEFYGKVNQILTDIEIQSIIGLHLENNINHNWISSYDIPSEQELYSRISRLDMKIFMAARVLTISDATSMYHSLEVRFPLIDKEIVEFSRTLPPHYKMNTNKATNLMPWNKYEGNYGYENSGIKKIFYEAFKEDLPTGFGARRKKGFRFPSNQWTKSDLKQEIESNLLIKTKDDWQTLVLNKWLIKHGIEIPY